MLRCESVIPRRGRLTRTLAVWSFGIAVLGAAALDATRSTAPPARGRAEVTAALPADVRFLAADAPRPGNRLDVDGLTYRLTHRADDGGVALELRAPVGCVVFIDADAPAHAQAHAQAHPHGHAHAAPAPARVFVPDGAHTVRSSCDPDGTPVTRVVVVRERSR